MSPPNKTNPNQGPVHLDLDDPESIATFDARIAARNAEKEKAPKPTSGNKGHATQLKKLAGGRKSTSPLLKQYFASLKADQASKPKSPPSTADLYGRSVGDLHGLSLSSSPTNAGKGSTEYKVGQISTVGRRESSKSAAHGRFSKPHRAQALNLKADVKPEAPQVSPKTVAALYSDEIGVTSGGLSVSSPQGGGGPGSTEYKVSLNFFSGDSGSTRLGGKHRPKVPVARMEQKGDKLIRAAKAPSKPKVPAPEKFDTPREPVALQSMSSGLYTATTCLDADNENQTAYSDGSTTYQCLLNYTNSSQNKDGTWETYTTPASKGWFTDADQVPTP